MAVDPNDIFPAMRGDFPVGQKFHPDVIAELQAAGLGGMASMDQKKLMWKDFFRVAAKRKIEAAPWGPEVARTFAGQSPSFTSAGQALWSDNPSPIRFENAVTLTDSSYGPGVNRLPGGIDEVSTTQSVHLEVGADGSWIAFNGYLGVADSSYNIFINGHKIAPGQTRWDVAAGYAGVEMQLNKGSYDVIFMTGIFQPMYFFWSSGIVVSKPDPRYSQIFIGDSYGSGLTIGSGFGSTMGVCIPNQLEMLLGMPCFNLSEGSTGLVRVNENVNGRQPYLSTNRRAAWNSVPKDLIKLGTVQCSGNDHTAIGDGSETQASLKAKYDTLWSQLATDFPGVPFLALGAQDGILNAGNMAIVNAAAKASAEAAPNVIKYVDQIGKDFVQGTGNYASPSYDGKNRSSIICADDTHPTEWGNYELTVRSLEEAAA